MEHPQEHTLHAYVDHTLDRQEAKALRAHLTQCPGCRREVNELTLLFDELKQLPVPRPNRGLTARILLARERGAREPHLPFDLFGFLFGRIGWTVVAMGLLTGVLLGHSALSTWKAAPTDSEASCAMACQEDPYLGYLISDNGDIL